MFLKLFRTVLVCRVLRVAFFDVCANLVVSVARLIGNSP